jgi:hypothetical protein
MVIFPSPPVPEDCLCHNGVVIKYLSSYLSTYLVSSCSMPPVCWSSGWRVWYAAWCGIRFEGSSRISPALCGFVLSYYVVSLYSGFLVVHRYMPLAYLQYTRRDGIEIPLSSSVRSSPETSDRQAPTCGLLHNIVF